MAGILILSHNSLEKIQNQKMSTPREREVREHSTLIWTKSHALLRDRLPHVQLVSLLAQRDAEMEALKQQVSELSALVKQSVPRQPLPQREASPSSSIRSSGTVSRALAPMAMAPNVRPLSPRGLSSAHGARSMSPRPSSPRREGGSSVAFGSTLSTARKPQNGAFFHASMRGGPLTEPLPQRGPTPQRAIKGPSLLTRDKFGAKRSEWEKFSMAATGEGSLFEDDNPFNDPFQYRPFKGLAFPPSTYIGPDDNRETDDLGHLCMLCLLTQPQSHFTTSSVTTSASRHVLLSLPSLMCRSPNGLRLSFVYGYCGRRARQNLFYNIDGRLVYHTAALGVVYDKEAHEQVRVQLCVFPVPTSTTRYLIPCCSYISTATTMTSPLSTCIQTRRR